MLVPRQTAWANIIHIQQISDDWRIMLSDKRMVALAAVAYPLRNKAVCKHASIEQLWQNRAITFSVEYTDRYGVPHGDIRDIEGNRLSDALIDAGCAIRTVIRQHRLIDTSVTMQRFMAALFPPAGSMTRLI